MRDQHTTEVITTWFQRAQLDYNDLYMRLYISYNAWFRQVTKKTNDHDAIQALKKRFVIWDDYCHAKTLLDLIPVVEQIVNVTKNASLGISVRDVYDWQSLIQFWYQVRCYLFHGFDVFSDSEQATIVKLAYLSLNGFMNEVISRMNRVFTNQDYQRLSEVEQALQAGVDSSTLMQTRNNLHVKFITSPDLWEVDMMRV